LIAHVAALLPRAIEQLASAGCTEAWLVGSFARGTPTPDSDVDLLVRGLAPDRRSDLVDALEHLFQRRVDLAELERIPSARLEVAQNGGRRLFP
jgi:predicted nucleotidyltransferase